jgi:putative heme-binding domain-containing protein
LETVSVVFTSSSPFKLNADNKPHTSVAKDGKHIATITVTPKQAGEWLPFEFTTETSTPELNVHWFTQEDARPRAFPLRRILLPWARPAGAEAPALADAKRAIPELNGGDWDRGQALFNGKAACATCHSMGTAGKVPKLGPDLANLIHRDYASVARDLQEPSAALNPEHIGQNVETTDGESFAAVLSGEKDGILTFIEAAGVRTVPRTRIKSMTTMTLSLMPQGIWDALTPEERRDLMTFLLTPPADPATARDPHIIQAVILTGLDGPFHQWEQTSVALKQELERDPRFHVHIITDPEWLASEALFKTDVLIQHYVNYNANGLSELARKNLLKYVNDGGGLAVMHFANGAFNPLTTGPANSDWPDYRRLFLQRAWVGKQGSTHDNYAPFRVIPTKAAHPITAGLAPFDTIDELYCNQVPSGESPEAEPLITAACRTTKRDEPLAWAFTRGKGRVFQSLLGHSHVSMHAAGEFHRRGIAWASGRDAVAKPFTAEPLLVPGAPAPRKMSEVKTILGTALIAKPDPTAKPLHLVLCASDKDAGHGKPGAHDYPLWRSRWSRLLNMADGIHVETANNWPDESQWHTADVIVFNSYNPSWANERDTAAVQKRGADMDRFLARGGGIVFIHYALNAGGNAPQLASRIGAAWQIPPARFRHGAKDWALDHTHPLATGFTKFEIPDESYWHLTGDLRTAGASILATSLEENAPTPQMWTREVGAGRVFVSIPGHFTWTYDDPLYRILILRGIMWTTRQPLDRLAPLSIIGARVVE